MTVPNLSNVVEKDIYMYFESSLKTVFNFSSQVTFYVVRIIRSNYQPRIIYSSKKVQG